jgi:hypothetical protein
MPRFTTQQETYDPPMESIRSMRERLRGRMSPEPLPSLYDRHPRAASAERRPRGLQVVPVDRIVGTARHPSQSTIDFLPLPELRGRNWVARWQRINRAFDQLSTLPAVDLLQVGEDYYVADGHNRVAAALQADAAAIDADVTELVLPGIPTSEAPPPAAPASTLLVGSDEVRQAASGRMSRTAEHRTEVDEVRREDLLSEPETVESETDGPPADPDGHTAAGA